MLSFSKWIRALMVGACLISCFIARGQETTEEVLPKLTIAIVRDGSSYLLDNMIEEVKRETNALLKSKHTVVFREDAAFNANWDASGARVALNGALNDPSIDMIILQGFFCLEEAASGMLPLTKPCVGAFVQDPQIVAPFVQNGRSTIKNLSVVVSDISLERDIKKFHELVGFKKVLYAVTDAYIDDLKQGGAPELIKKVDADLGIQHGFIPLSATAQDSLYHTPDHAEAIFFFPPLRFTSESDMEAYITGVNARAIPTFAMNGQQGVADGFLFGTMPELQTQLARRAALNIKDILDGKEATAIDALFRVERQLYVNIVTAAEIGYDLPTTMLYDAVLVGGEAPDVTASPLQLVKAVELAQQANYELRSRRQSTEASYELSRQAFSGMLPQVDAVLQYTRNDDSLARDSLGTVPRQSTSIGVGVSQMVYDDDTVTGYRIAKQDYEAAAFQEQGFEADTIQLAAAAYLRYLAAKSILAVAQENLEVTRTNLGLARVRLDVGTAGPEQVYRFEAQEASDRASVSTAESQVSSTLTALNRVLGQDDLTTTWNAEDIGLESDSFDVTSRRVIELMTSEARKQRFRLFSLQHAMAHAPELEAADRTVAARELDYGLAQRSFVVPSVGVNFNYLNTFHKDTYESAAAAGAGGNTPNDEWSFTVQASLPIFEGGDRVFNLLRQKALVRSEEYNRSVTRQIVEQRVLNALYDLEASFSDIRFSRVAADRAQKNLDIVTEKYRVGRVNIVDLLDAQNQAFIQKQNEVISTYSFLESLVNYMRSINWFEFLATEQQQDDWIDEVQRFVEPTSPTSDRGQ